MQIQRRNFPRSIDFPLKALSHVIKTAIYNLFLFGDANALNHEFYSAVPYSLGPHLAVKYKLKPEQSLGNIDLTETFHFGHSVIRQALVLFCRRFTIKVSRGCCVFSLCPNTRRCL